MFGFGKKKKEAAAQEASSADVYVAPATGEYLPLSEVSDPVFSQGVMGDGYAVNPTARHHRCTRCRHHCPDSGHPARIYAPHRKRRRGTGPHRYRHR